ncbi:MAG: dTDP-4-dehydrorhamnose 3,5-epimerase [Candidatus Eremiobacteraeota bacterium]|nr:dTDP-4-dehydrorhamnose 3,5-epimerase [Candidatus Eremiobacteraeota bacterium]
MIDVIPSAVFPDVRLYVPEVFLDGRGYFKETFSRRKYAALGMQDDWVQDSVSHSRRNVIRGMHIDDRMAKLVQALKGTIYDVVVDARENSPTFRRWEAFTLSDGNHHQLYVPAGFAHGFLAQSDEVIVMYKVSAHYDPAFERGMRWNDPAVGIDWPLDGEPILSAKDAAL